MTCPKEFTTEYIVQEDVPYKCVELVGRGTYSSEGTLNRGRLVWGLPRDDKQQFPASMQVYAEGVGIVSIAARFVKLSE